MDGWSKPLARGWACFAGPAASRSKAACSRINCDSAWTPSALATTDVAAEHHYNGFGGAPIAVDPAAFVGELALARTYFEI